VGNSAGFALNRKEKFANFSLMAFEKIKTVVFDLDNTLFDHTRAEREALLLLLRECSDCHGVSDADAFVDEYVRHNAVCWQRLARGEISVEDLKILRLKQTFAAFNITGLDYVALAERYLELYSGQCFVLPGMLRILHALKPRFTLGILSNGFAVIQRRKLSNMDIDRLIDFAVFSEDVGVMKPDARIFRKVMTDVGNQPEELVYVGDSYDSDIVGAKSVNWRAILFNPTGIAPPGALADAQVAHLFELIQILCPSGQ